MFSKEELLLLNKLEVVIRNILDSKVDKTRKPKGQVVFNRYVSLNYNKKRVKDCKVNETD